MNITLTTAPSVEPVTASEAKAHIRVTISADDALITAQIIAARTALERYTGRAFINQTWTAYLDAWPSAAKSQWWDGTRDGSIAESFSPAAIELPLGPIGSVTSVTTYSDADAATVVSASTYYVDTAGARIVPRSGASISAGTRVANGLVIVWVAGYGAAAANVPEPLRQAIMQTVAAMYESRGEASDAGTATAALLTIPPLARALADPYRVLRGALS